jgi:hypothetical protein
VKWGTASSYIRTWILVLRSCIICLSISGCKIKINDRTQKVSVTFCVRIILL